MRAEPYRQRRIDMIADSAMTRHGRDPQVALPVLQDVQAVKHCLDRPILGAVADALGINDARVYGIASFYSLFSTEPGARKLIRVCDGPVCMLRGAHGVGESFRAAATEAGCAVERCSCLGLCDCAPAMLRETEPCGPMLAGQLAGVLSGNRCRTPPDYAEPVPGELRRTMARIGRIDPESIDSALEAHAYHVLGKALTTNPATIRETVSRSGLRGCGGGGFATGRKWQLVAQAGGAEKYVVCNADESEPGAFKDRVLSQGDPHLLLEGLALAGYAVGASHGIIYIRGEYEWIAQRLEHAIAQAEDRGWLGPKIQGNQFSFRVRVQRGAGAYICGEETALLESLEGKRGEPRLRPPYPVTQGYLGKPTLVNNVETLCSIPLILARGVDWFRSAGTAASPGTKVFTVSGCVNRPGAFEAPLGITLRQIIEQFGAGMRDGSAFKAALTGGAAGLFAPAALLDTPIDFDADRQGAALGSGAMIILDESVSIPNMLTGLVHFFEVESCGKCTPCREGTREARMRCERLAKGEGRTGDVSELHRLARLVNQTSLCGLGRSIAWPIKSALEHFREEFKTRHISTGRDPCPE